MAVVQYTNEFHGEKIAKSMKTIQNNNSTEKLSNKYFHFRLAKNDVAFGMTGYKFNCITPFLMKAK
jgi:prolyl-tRNA editing enzyme YbaK/EbsC (Cys-tRNA(Pro) deacylase)